MLIESIKKQFTLNPMYVFEDLYTLLCEKLVQLVAGFSVLSLLLWVNLVKALCRLISDRCRVTNQFILFFVN